jgi:hypothetical protein
MLIYESEGFLEVESKQIKRLCRSTASVPLVDAEPEAYAVQAVLCDYLENSEQHCCVAFYSKILKRSLVFAIKGSEKQSSWQHGQELLSQLGFELDDVNLKLSPAMLEVVLRDVPGLLSPADARKQRTEKALLFTELQETYDNAPDSAQGKKAALKLNAEKRLNNRSKELRQILEGLFSTEEAARAEHEEFSTQMKNLTVKLEAAEALAESERNHREMSESITAAAEKRIQELEEVLVDVETESSKALKLKQKNTQLRARIKELGGELKSAEVEIEKGREKQEQSVADAKDTHERISLLEKELKEAKASVENIQVQLADEQAERSQLGESFQEAELRIKALNSELENSAKHATLQAEEVKSFEDVQAQLAEVQLALKDSLASNRTLEEKLAAANEQIDGLEERLCAAEKTSREESRDESRLLALTEQNEQLSRDLKDLRDEYAQECSTRKHLEGEALKEGERIQRLEEALAEATEKASDLSGAEKVSSDDSRELASVRVELQEMTLRLKAEQQSREDLESEVDETHKLIDSLEKMLRETEGTGTEDHSAEVLSQSDGQKVQVLEERLKAVEGLLDQELVEKKRLTRAVAVAEKKIAAQEDLLVRGQAEQREREARESVAVESVVQKEVKPAKLLPHDLRPAPKKGSLFRPDWDLEGLPCQSSKQVFKAWETVFNVQISLEGYPSQYCMAFLVVLRLKKQKKLYMLYRLKQSKHTLVCVPAKAPKDEASLKKTIKDGLSFLKKSGFEMDEMTAENIDSALKTYFLES